MNKTKSIISGKKAYVTPVSYCLNVKGSTICTSTDDDYNSTMDTPSNKGMFKKPFSFKGRIRRKEFFLSLLIWNLWGLLCAVELVLVLSPTQGPKDPSVGFLVLSIFILISDIPVTWFILAQNAKRCHDRGNSGWFQLIPFYGLVLLFGDGDKGPNQYGDSPK